IMEMDGVELEFTPEAIESVAGAALDRGTGARGLRSILEEVLREVMFEIPSRNDVARVVITPEVIDGTAEPTIITHRQRRVAREKSA
ncbi:MAG: ATP-dependent Clp protease ATP-binding subunit ClpX, partial [Actinobacteria bacterium]|nr:ATP-dependent Clp protease ATP-binding subunit ClpX [Actinomycetota bacterium]